MEIEMQLLWKCSAWKVRRERGGPSGEPSSRSEGRQECGARSRMRHLLAHLLWKVLSPKWVGAAATRRVCRAPGGCAFELAGEGEGDVVRAHERWG